MMVKIINVESGGGVSSCVDLKALMNKELDNKDEELPRNKDRNLGSGVAEFSQDPCFPHKALPDGGLSATPRSLLIGFTASFSRVSTLRLHAKCSISYWIKTSWTASFF